MSQRESGGMYPNYVVDVPDLVQADDPLRRKWRQEMADQWSNALSGRVRQMGSQASPQDILAIMTIALTDALACSCVTDRDGYEVKAKEISDAVLARLLRIRPGIEAAMARQYLLLKPEGNEGRQ